MNALFRMLQTMIVERLLCSQILEVSRGVDGSNRDSSMTTRIEQTHRHFVDQNSHGAPRISCLLVSQRPHAIVFCIAQFIILTLKAMRQTGPFTHIGKKLLKLSPAWIDGDPASPVVFVLTASWLRRSRNHTLPRLIAGTSSAASCIAMFPWFELQAATRFCQSAFQRIATNGRIVSAKTATVPSRSSSQRIKSAFQHGQLSELLAHQIQWLHTVNVSYMPMGVQPCR